MATIFIDYTQLYYREIAASACPPVISGKFVRIRKESADYLVFSPTEFTKYHANIVERFCLDKGIEGRYDAKGKRYEIADSAWTVDGGGKYEIDRNKKAIKLYDNSMAYGKFDRAWLQDAILSIPDFSGFSIQIE